MPLNKNIKKILVIGSGPIVIGQAAEFDYAGSQACAALREEGIEIVLINSNPATIMTDKVMADKIYIEPLTLPVVKRIIEIEKPDGVLSTLGGQTGLNLSMQLAKDGFLEKNKIKLLGANPATIDKSEDRKLFKEAMQSINQPCIPSVIATEVEHALAFAGECGYPVIIRPAFTLGGSGGGIANTQEELEEICSHGLALSPIRQVLVERCVSGWKEIEFELIRDSAGNIIVVCCMENVDPIGVHTGDSIVVAPSVTLAEAEFTMLKTAAVDIVNELKIEGGCNVQFALSPDSLEYAIIEVNPRVSRSSALASKATGYPIAKVATKIAVGYLLNEIKNAVTGVTYACTEPAIDYIVVKFPRWPFDKFVYANKKLGTQMKATGEVMAIGATFEEALMKAVRGAEIRRETMSSAALSGLSDAEIEQRLGLCDDERIFTVYEALKRGITVDKVYEITRIDKWFLSKLKNLDAYEKLLSECENLTNDIYLKGKKLGFLDKTIESLSGKKIEEKVFARYKTVDTCAAEYEAETPYFYSGYDSENEALEFKKKRSQNKKTIIVFGSGPIRIGQGIEFDYASVHCVKALKKLGYDVVIVNNNPETVSTDFNTADRLYFEPLHIEDVMNIINTEQPYGVVVAFGGQTAIKLADALSRRGVNILGTSSNSIDLAEDRGMFDGLLESLNIKRPLGFHVSSVDEGLSTAKKLGYPVLLRPSFVIGGQNMIIAFNDDDTREYMNIILKQNPDNGILVDKYMRGIEIEVDAISDGEDVLIPGIMEHIERAGVHSGDSIAVYPTFNVDAKMINNIIECSKKLSVALGVKGIINIQYLINRGELYVIEANPRASRTVPYISKVTNIPMVELATRAMMGGKIKAFGYGADLYKTSPYYAVKVPVFSFEKLTNVDSHLGPEMKSTGEVLGIAATLEEALYKGLTAAGFKIKKSGGVLISVRDDDKNEIYPLAKKFADLGFKLYATKGTCKLLTGYGLAVEEVKKINEEKPDILDVLDSGKISYVISTSSKGRIPSRDSVKIRRKAIEKNIPCLTSLDTANAVANCIMSRYSVNSFELININAMRAEKLELKFIKMQSCSNDYIYFDCLDENKNKINNPEGLSVRLSDRHKGIGSDGLVLILKSGLGADAKLRQFNRDGSEGKMGGNAVRCVAKYLYDNNIVRKDKMTIETNSGIKEVEVFVLDNEVKMATVNMGMPDFTPKNIPAEIDTDKIINRKINICGNDYEITCLSIGNPHCVIFYNNIDALEIEKHGANIENSDYFPERINVDFVKYINKTTLKLRVWERGSGETLSCGTGACAAAIAAVEKGLCDKNTEITVHLKGGVLKVVYTDDGVYLTGDAVKSFEGSITI